MTTTAKDPKATCQLIKDIASLYVSKPEALDVRFQEFEAGIMFGLRGHEQDDPKLVGKDGAHADSLLHLVWAAGLVNGENYSFRLLTSPPTCTPFVKQPPAKSYDPEPAKALLTRWLNALGSDKVTVTAVPVSGTMTHLTFDFNVQFPSLQEGLGFTTIQTGAMMTSINALGTLFRAIAKQAGVRFGIRIL